MFRIVIESPFFNYKSKVEQHKLVTTALSEEIKNIHGFNLKTRDTTSKGQPNIVLN